MAKLNLKKAAMSVGTRAGGAILGGGVNYALHRFVPDSIDPKLKAGGGILIGAILPEMSPKSELLKSAGAGMAGAAADRLLQNLFDGSAATSGIGEDTPYIIEEDNMNVNGVDENGNPIEGTNEDPISGQDESPISGIENVEVVEE